MTGLMWLDSHPGWVTWQYCLTFVRDSDERTVLAGFGADIDEADEGYLDNPSVRVGRSGGWVVTLEENPDPWGMRPDVLRAISGGTEAVAICKDMGKGYHQFAHACDGEIIASVITTVPLFWSGTDPERLRSLAEELGLGGGADGPLTNLEVLLTLGERVWGLTLDEADVDRFSPPVPLPEPLRELGPGPVDPWTTKRVRAHAQDLINAGMAEEAIAAQITLPAYLFRGLLSGELPVIPGDAAQRILAIEVPTGDAS